MTTTVFQKVFDLAETITVDRKAVVAQTITRDQTVRSVSRGGQTWRFEVRLPDGLPWDELRGTIEALDKADRVTTGVARINQATVTEWFNRYQGDANAVTGFAATVSDTPGDTVTLTSTGSGLSTGEYTLRVGDFVQLGSSGHVYTVAEDVVYPAPAVKLNRPVLESPGSYSLVVGPNVAFNVICVEMPTWTLFQRNQVSWSGSFKFMEVL